MSFHALSHCARIHAHSLQEFNGNFACKLTLNPLVNGKLCILFLFESLITIMVNVYVSLLAMRLLFGDENVFVCDF